MKDIRKHSKKIAMFLLLNFVVEIVNPVQLYALTSGPTQPEVQSFQPISVSDMVSPFTGDFSYNIPLMDVDGYPINLSYSSGITTDQEASWVGLGWNINPGAITRNMRGIPDEFNGDIIETDYNLRPNRTIGLTIGGQIADEVFGLKTPEAGAEQSTSVKYSMSVNFNNYNGFGFEQTVTPGINAAKGAKGPFSGSLGLSTGSSGFTISPSISYSEKSMKNKKADQMSYSVGSSFNSRSGLGALSLSAKNISTKDQPKGGANGAINFGMPTYTPDINMPMRNTNISFSYKGGGEIIGVLSDLTFSGYYAEQALNIADNTKRTPAYGYNNTHNRVGDYSVMDINRSWDGGYNENTPSLPVTNHTFDIFSVAGQGVDGSYRPFRSDFGFVSDNYANNISQGGSLGLELGSGNTAKLGIDFSVNSTYSDMGAWNINTNGNYSNPAAGKLKWKKGQAGDAYEPYAYKQMGELSVDDEPELFQNIGGIRPVRVGLTANSNRDFNVRTTEYLETKDNGQIGLVSDLYRKKRLKRNQVLSIVTFADLPYKGMGGNPHPLFAAPKHHTGEMTVIRSDGARYVYGIPAYNVLQEETSFSMGTKTRKEVLDRNANLDASNGLIDYTFNNTDKDKGDNSTKNKKGKDHYYECTKMPSFAHSYLLSAVLSTDYVDADNVRGPSVGDIGNYTVFKYQKSPNAFKWRTPFGSGQANYNEGLRSTYNDDKANYIYGEKEIWYLEKIETKNMIAVFTLENRKDGYESAGRNGGLGEQSMKLLRKISVYNKPDYDKVGISAVPVKEVHFEYDYSLCPGTENNIDFDKQVTDVTKIGKLTLKKVYYTYGTSRKSAFSPYSFDYTNIYNSNFNPAYGVKNHDRWGNYKQNSGNYMAPTQPGMVNSDFPYLTQDKAEADKNATAWTLSKITMPSGGVIKVYSESDDYAYVQDKKAMQMFTLQSVENEENPANPVDFFSGNELRNFSLDPFKEKNNQYLCFKLQEPIPTGPNALTKFRNSYLQGINELYFKALVKVIGDDYEYVSGYAEIENSGLKSYMDPNGYYNYGWIKLKEVNQGDAGITADVNPISKAAWHFARTYLPELIYNNTDDETPGVERFINKLSDLNFAKTIIQTIQGANGYLKANGFCKEIVPDKSFIRLQNPNRKKLGGGLRVKKIELSDEWDKMVTGNTAKTYGQEYDYTTIDPATNEMISSGVAAWEPQIGGDENPFHLPLWFGDKKQTLLIPQDKGFLNGPMGQEFYPGATVGYSKITIKNTGHANIKRHATGKIVKEFYTAKDFPSISNSTGIDPKPRKTNKLLKIFKINVKDYMTVTQGHAVEVNDMHGKPKASWVYQEDNPDPISGTEYKYKSERYGDGTFKLVNDALFVRPNGTTEIRTIGLEYDMVPDFREEKTETISVGLNNNLSSFIAGFIPGIVPIVLPSSHQEFVKFRSAVLTKVINRYGILEETIAYDFGSRVSTKNLAYDSETGLVLLTKAKTNFEDDIYTFNYPAHWYYDAMGQAYKNLGLLFSGLSPNVNGEVTINKASELLVVGDEIVADNKDLAWVKAINGNVVTLMNEMGNPFKPGGSITNMVITRSGRRNLIGVTMGSITALSNPVEGLESNSFSKILTSTSQVFKDEWQTFCECFQNDSRLKNTNNPYVIGTRGIWRGYKGFAYLVDRKHSWKNNNTDIRNDGVYTSFNPFWKYSGGKISPDETNWTWTTEITIMSPFGSELENKDPLLRYSGGVYGYNNTMPIAVVGNARYREIAFDGFEDYDFNTCSDDHFSFKPHKLSLNNTSHSGRKSISVSAGANLSISKNLSVCTP
jgi:hypothetical protein